ncbi:hypothetical protein [Aerolutibacter ruishenii]|uniref:Uncharacterized protein n=1 Tax=Aerolutibacter ruishenii TaxID=686800 RepID=A0A562LST2_9GAMM|nr:hypothetical protein [Lysobacter ruishenii]TWI10666.1 hypothetical protein IP93_01756 [Lysobacter ruishenii]
MKTTTRLMLTACLALPLLAACKKEDAAKPEAVVQAPLVAPTTNDENAWGTYLQDVVKRNLDGVTGQPYLYFLPAEETPDFQGYYDRLLEQASTDLQRGILEGNLVAYGSPSSSRMADLVIASFAKVQPGAMKGVKMLFLGNSADNERVKAAVAPAGVDYKFIETR